MSASIRTIFDSAVAHGVRPEFVRGASDDAVEQVRVSQGVSAIPQAVHDIWLLFGENSGPWWAGESTTVGDLDGELKEIAVELYDSEGGGLSDASGMLVLLDHQGYEFHVIDGVDLGNTDPPVWLLMEGQPATKMWSSVTEWFDTATGRVLALKERIRRMQEEGGRSTRSKYFLLEEEL